jgi:hypothetical protein
MFYLPTKRPAGLIVHIHQGRHPLNPQEWVNLISDDLLLSPPPPAPPQMHSHGDAAWRKDALIPIHQIGFVQWAIDYWRARGRVNARAGHSYGCWRNTSPLLVVVPRTCAPFSTNRQGSPATRSNDAGISRLS